MEFSVFDHLIDGTVVVDKDFQIVYSNQGFQQFTEIGRSRLAGKTFASVVKMVPEHFNEVDLKKITAAIPYKHAKMTVGDKEFQVQVAIQPIEKSQWLIYIHDITIEDRLHVKYRDELKSKESLISSLDKRLSALSLLYDISQAIHFSTNMEQVVNLVLSKLELSFGFGPSFAFFFNQDPFRLRQHMLRKSGSTKTTDGASMEGFDQYLKSSLERSAPLFVQAGTHAAFDRFLSEQAQVEVNNYLMISVKSLENIGMIVLLNNKAWKPSEEDLDLIGNIGTQMMLAVDIFNYYEKSIRDGLTGLYNARYFKAQLETEISRAERSTRQSSLLLMDVDHFKKFNDTYGHATGDRVLQQVASIVRRSCRATDMPARYGGEEFVILLPDTPPEGALLVAERLRKSVESTPLKSEHGDLRITISVGVATCPLHANTPGSLMECADQAMYKAKNSGRNKALLYVAENLSENPPENK